MISTKAPVSSEEQATMILVGAAALTLSSLLTGAFVLIIADIGRQLRNRQS
jgi:hypothetical protein